MNYKKYLTEFFLENSNSSQKGQLVWRPDGFVPSPPSRDLLPSDDVMNFFLNTVVQKFKLENQQTVLDGLKKDLFLMMREKLLEIDQGALGYLAVYTTDKFYELSSNK